MLVEVVMLNYANSSHFALKDISNSFQIKPYLLVFQHFTTYIFPKKSSPVWSNTLNKAVQYSGTGRVKISESLSLSMFVNVIASVW